MGEVAATARPATGPSHAQPSPWRAAASSTIPSPGRATPARLSRTSETETPNSAVVEIPATAIIPAASRRPARTGGGAAPRPRQRLTTAGTSAASPATTAVSTPGAVASTSTPVKPARVRTPPLARSSSSRGISSQSRPTAPANQTTPVRGHGFSPKPSFEATMPAARIATTRTTDRRTRASKASRRRVPTGRARSPAAIGPSAQPAATAGSTTSARLPAPPATITSSPISRWTRDRRWARVSPARKTRTGR